MAADVTPRWESNREKYARHQVRMRLADGVLIADYDPSPARSSPWKVRAYSYREGDLTVWPHWGFERNFDTLQDAQEKLEDWAKQKGWL